jgi:hypothetical protein
MTATAHGPANDSPSVTVRRADLARAAADGLISPAQAASLWSDWIGDPALTPVETLRASAPTGPRFGFTNVLYYFGGMLAIGSMSLFMSMGWSALGAGGLLAITLVNILICLVGAGWLERRALATPAGILVTLALVMVPLAAWCLQNVAGLWPDGEDVRKFSAFHEYIDGRWLVIEAVTLAAAVALFLRFRHPFMVMPVAVTIWYVSMDAVDGLMHHHSYEWGIFRDASLVFGLLTTLAAIWLDLRLRLAGSRKDFAFWLYVFGVIMFWSSLSLHDSGSALGKLAYFAINVALVFFGAAIGRRVFTIFGALGVAGLLGNVSHDLFENSLIFPFALCLLGLSVVALGVWWQRREAAIQAVFTAWLPPFLQPLAAPLAPDA